MKPLFPIPQKRTPVIDRYFRKLYTLRPSDAFLLRIALLFLVVFLTLTLISSSKGYTTQVAAEGGTFTEGIVGTPRFVNPVLAVTRPDKDLSALVYDGLMTLGKEGVLIPHVAESITVSEDGLTYNVILKKTVQFHDGTPLTAKDVAFTVSRIQNPELASPLRANFDGVTVETIGEYELNFILTEAYAPFKENLTFGIIPEHIWKGALAEDFEFSQYNSEPIGSGPYKVQEIKRNTFGIPETYVLTAHREYFGEKPKIETIELHFYPTDSALLGAFSKGIVESAVGISPEMLPKYDIKPETHHLERIPLPRTFALFFNQNKSPALRDKAAREALEHAVDRSALIESVLKGYGNPLTSPIPKGFGVSVLTEDGTTPRTIDAARDILRDGGWEFNANTQVWEKEIDGTLTPLSFSIATANNATFEATATFLQNTWQQLGVPVTIKQFEQSDLTQAVIRPRDYEALLFGAQVGRSLDFFSFWHSSQRNDPGLNVALYANITTDSILIELRRKAAGDGTADAMRRFALEINEELPALFLYTPELLYIFPNRVQGATFAGVSEPHERLKGVERWYIETESVWPFFTQ